MLEAGRNRTSFQSFKVSRCSAMRLPDHVIRIRACHGQPHWDSTCFLSGPMDHQLAAESCERKPRSSGNKVSASMLVKMTRLLGFGCERCQAQVSRHAYGMMGREFPEPGTLEVCITFHVSSLSSQHPDEM